MGRILSKNAKSTHERIPLYRCGVDEVGRGCLAGPVTVAAVAMPKNLKISAKGGSASGRKDQKSKSQPKIKKLLPLRDSKKLTPEQREKWFAYVKSQPKISYAKASVYPKVIDRINISQAANLAATRALARLVVSMKYKVSSMGVLLDGGLYLNKIPNTKYLILNTRTVVRADEKFNCVKLASIVAKVSRDRLMKKLHKKYPQYGLDKHKGYGTEVHISAIRKHGYCELHRQSFIGNLFDKNRRFLYSRY